MGEPIDTPAEDVEPRPAEVPEVFGAATEAISTYVDMLLDEGVTWGLIGAREQGRIWSRHILNSVAIATAVPRDAHVVDVGSGAGLPGVPLALARPDLGITLLEPLQRRVAFLELVLDRLDLHDRVRVVRARAEEHDTEYDVVTARAVGGLSKLLPWCAPLMAADGQMLLLKGVSAADEVEAARRELDRAGLRPEILSVRAHPLSEPTTALRLRRR